MWETNIIVSRYFRIFVKPMKTLCTADQSTMRRQLHDTMEELGGEYEIFVQADEKSDILLEVQKTIVQAICMVLKFTPVDSTRYYIENFTPTTYGYFNRGISKSLS